MTVLRPLALVSIVIAAVSSLAAQGPAAPAGLTRHTWMVDGVERSALVAAPTVKPPDTGGPLVMVFHGHGGSSLNAARTFLLHEAWPEALVIYPQGLPTVGALTDPEGRLAGWQQKAGGESDRDLRLVDAMLAWAKDHYAIDHRRIFAAGHSNGGSMVYVLWAARGDRFAAFAPSSSVFRLDAIAQAKPKPAFIVAGRQDALVPFAAQQLSLSGVLRLNHAEVEGRPWAGGAQQHSSAIGAEVITYIHPGGHPMPEDAGALMARFFKSVATK